MPLPGGSGMPVCAPGTTRTLPEREPSPPPFRTELVVPSAAELQGASSILITGAMCVGGGRPAFDESGESAVPICVGGPEGARAEVLVLSIPLAVSAEVEANRHPTLADEPWTLDGAAWDALGEDDAPEACAEVAGTPALPRVVAEPLRELRITIGASADDRQEYASTRGDPPMPVTVREALQINHYASAGAMERGVSAVDELTTADPPIDVDWELPPAGEVPASGRPRVQTPQRVISSVKLTTSLRRLVRFYLIALCCPLHCFRASQRDMNDSSENVRQAASLSWSRFDAC